MIQFSGTAGVLTQAGCGFNRQASSPLCHSREDIADTEVRSGAVLDHGDSNRGPQ